MTFRRTLFWTHLIVGLSAGLVILSMCATGLLLAFEPQIVDFAERGIRFVPLPDPAVQRLPLETLFERARETAPHARTTGIQLDPDPRASARIRFGRVGNVYVNPYTGQVLGKDSRTQDFFRAVEQWHRWLGSKKIGKPITGACAILFFWMALSGIYLWWSAFTKATAEKSLLLGFRPSLTGKARNWNWHTVTGFWSSVYLILITGTGIWMSYASKKPPLWVVPLHTGRAWGWIGQTLNFFAAAAGLFLIYTGFALAFRRFFKKSATF